MPRRELPTSGSLYLVAVGIEKPGNLGAMARTADDPLRVVVTLRDDFLVRAEQLPALEGIDDQLAAGLLHQPVHVAQRH